MTELFCLSASFYFLLLSFVSLLSTKIFIFLSLKFGSIKNLLYLCTHKWSNDQINAPYGEADRSTAGRLEMVNEQINK